MSQMYKKSTRKKKEYKQKIAGKLEIQIPKDKNKKIRQDWSYELDV